MYDAVSTDYDRFVNWPSRLAIEMPFIEQQFQKAARPVVPVLDAACGTGMHTVALAQLGYQMSGADTSRGMIERARANAGTAGVSVQFEIAGFEHFAETFGQGAFDAVLCLGNSLPHIGNASVLAATLADFAACLHPGGFLLLQNRNFDAVLSHRERWMDPQAYRYKDAEWVFLRFYDFDADGSLSFHMITLHRQGTAPWTQQVTTTRLYPLRQDELVASLREAGFIHITSFGSMSETPFDPESSGNLVITAISGNAL